MYNRFWREPEDLKKYIKRGAQNIDIDLQKPEFDRLPGVDQDNSAGLVENKINLDQIFNLINEVLGDKK